MTQEAPIAPEAVKAPEPPAPRPAIHHNKPKEYETIYILRSDVDADNAERVQARVVEVIDRAQAKLVKVEGWGRRRLAYPIAKQRRGVYVYVRYVGMGGLVAELERNLSLQDVVLKFQTVKVREDVDVAALAIDPEEVKLARLEPAPEGEDKEESREKVLGLVDFGEGAPARPRRDEDGDEFADEDIEPASTGEPESGEEKEKKPEEPS